MHVCTTDFYDKSKLVGTLQSIARSPSDAEARLSIRWVPAVHAGGSKLYFRSYGRTNCGHAVSVAADKPSLLRRRLA